MVRIIIVALLVTSCCLGIAFALDKLVKHEESKVKAKCHASHSLLFHSNLCPVLRQKLPSKLLLGFTANSERKLDEAHLEKLHKFQTRQLKADEGDENSDELEVDRFESPLLSFRIIGCGMVTILVGMTIIIYVTTNMFFIDSVAQICSELCLLSGYTGILLITTDGLRVDFNFCKGIAIFLQFAFLSYFTFALIEVICMLRLLFKNFPEWIFPSIKSVLLIGWGVPSLITIISAATLHNQYISRYNCWLNLDKNALWPTVLPIGIFCGMQIISLIAVICVSTVPYSLSQPQHDRAKCFLTTRWASAIIMLVAIIAWSTGIMATHRNSEPFFVAFTVASIFLGAVVLSLRISSDPFVRRAVSSNVLVHFIKPNRSNKVTAWSDKVIKAGEVAPPSGKKDIDHLTVPNGDNHEMVSHR